MPVARGLLLAGLVLFGAFVMYVLIPSPGGAVSYVFDTYVFSALLLLSAAVCLLQGFVSGDTRRVWLAIGIGIMFWWGGDLYTRVMFADGTPSVPSIADALNLMFYPAIFVGLFTLLRRLSDVPRSLWIQGVIAALAIAAIDSALVLEGFDAGGTNSTSELATNLAYPMADLVLLMMVFGARAVAGGQLGRSWNWLTGALIMLAAADSIHLYQSASGDYSEGGLLDLFWPGAMLLMALAALYDEGETARLEVDRRWLTAPSTFFALAAVGLVVVDHFHPFGVQTLVPAAGAMVFAIVDMTLVQRDHLKLLEQSRAENFVDSVTGIPNRRALVRDLEHYCEMATEEKPVLLYLHDLSGFKVYNDKFGHLAGDALLGRLGDSLMRVASGFGGAYRHSGDEFCVVARASLQQAAAISRVTGESLHERGDGFEITSHTGAVVIPQEARDPISALKLADQRLYVEKYRNSSVSPQESAAMIRLMQTRPSSAGKFTRLIEETLKLSGSLLKMHADKVEAMVQGFQLRDIGNSAIPEAILNKRGKLTEEEWQVIHSHTIVGERILNAIPSTRPAAEIVRFHHERFDGGGYPDGLAGEAIPAGARLVAVAQAFEGMTTDRPHRPAKTFREAVAELGSEAGKQFDPRALAVFCQALDSLSTASVPEAAQAASFSPQAQGVRPVSPAERLSAVNGGTGQQVRAADDDAPRPAPGTPDPRPATAPMGVIDAYVPEPRRAPAMFN